MPDVTNTVQQVKFYKGSLATYNSNVASYSGGVFFDTNNLDIYLDGFRYTEHRYSLILSDSSVKPVGDVPYLIIDSSTNTSSNDYTSIKLPKIVGTDAIDSSLGQLTGDFTVSLKLNNQNNHAWLTQSSNGLQFNENLLETFKINNKGILSNSWLTAADVSVGSTPSVSGSNLTIDTSDTVALALQKVKRIAETNKLLAIKYITIANSSGTAKANLNSDTILETLTIQDGSYIDITHPSGSDNKIVISTTLQAGDNITISNDGKINAEGCTYWMEID